MSSSLGALRAYEIVLGTVSKNADAVSVIRNTVEGVDESHRYFNAIIDGVKVAHYYLDLFDKANPWVGFGANVSNLGKAVYDIERNKAAGKPIELGQTLAVVTSTADIFADFALTNGARMLQPQMVMTGLLLKGATTGLTYLGMIYGERPLFPTSVVDSNSNVVTSEPGETVYVIGRAPLEIRDENGEVLVQVLPNNSGGIAGLTFYQTDNEGTPYAVDLDLDRTANGLEKLTTHVRDKHNNPMGVMTQEALLGGGTRLEVLDSDGNAIQTTTRSVQVNSDQTVQVTEIINHLAAGSDVASVKELLTSDGGRVVNTATADGRITEETWSRDPETGASVKQSTKIISYSEAERDLATADAALAGLEFMQALRSGNKLQAAASLIRLVNQAQVASNAQPVLGAIGTGFSGAVSVLSALDAWGDASDGERIALTARAVLGANEVVKAFSADGNTGFIENSAILGALQGVVALANLGDVLESGNPFAIASTFVALNNSAALMGVAGFAAIPTPITIGLAIASIIFGSLFGDDIEYPSPPPAGTMEVGALVDGSLGLLVKDSDGNTHQSRRLNGQLVSDTGRGVDTQDWGLGAAVLSQHVVPLIAGLQEQAAATGMKLVLERLPVISVHGFPSFDSNGVDNFFFAVRYDHPVSGAQQMLASAWQDLPTQFKEVAAYAGALVSTTEWAQIQAKQTAGDAFATETEGQYVDRLSGEREGDSLLSKAQSDAQEAANTQTYSLLTLDLEGDGVAKRTRAVAGMDLDSVKADTTQGVTRIDVDNDGYMELTEWVGSKEAILGIDRNGDGMLTSANELFSGGELSDSAENLGLKRLAFFDANKDGKLDKLDVYFNSFKLWIDINGDARTGVAELYGLSEAGIQSIDVNTGAVKFDDGQSIQLQRTQLSADVRGVGISGESDGKGGFLVGQYTVHQEGRDPELNLTADAAEDLSDILKLVKPNANPTDAEKETLKALAEKYGIDLSDPSALLALGGGGNVAGSPTSTTTTPGDVFTISQEPNAEEIKLALRAFFNNMSLNPDAGPAISSHVFHGREDTEFRVKASDLLMGLAGTSVVSVQDARRGAVRLDGSGDIVFNSAANEHGTGYFTYTAKDEQGRTSTAMVWLTIASVNDAPVAVADSFSVKEDNTLTIALSQLLANDTDADIGQDEEEVLTVRSVSGATNGTVSLVNGQVVFTANANYQGVASFDYTVSDAAGATSTSTVTVNVVGENDAPVVSGNTRKISARPDALLRIEAATLLSYVNDADIPYGDVVALKRVLSVSAGNAWQQKDGSVLFKAGSLGDVTLRIEMVDTQGSAVIVPIVVNVSANNATSSVTLPGTDQASEDTMVRIASTQTIVGVVSASNGSAWLEADGSLVYNPNRNFNGDVQVAYIVRNSNGSTENRVSDFRVAAVNDAPFVTASLATQNVDEDGALTILPSTLLATINDVDIATNGQTLRVSRVGEAINGTVVLATNGNVIFTPNKDFNGSARFTYWVSDDAGASVAAQANVSVRSINDAPNPLALRFNTIEDERRTFSNAAMISNAALVDVDTRTNGDVLKVTSVSMTPADAAKGSVSVDGAGNVTFTPTANYHGTASFRYTLTDNSGASGVNTVTLSIASINDAPIAKSSQHSLTSGTEDTVRIINASELTSNFTDVDGDALSIRSVTNSYGGSVSIVNGQVRFTPVKDFNGVGSFSYTVSDPFGATATSTALVNFVNVNDAPVAAYKRIDGRAYEDVDLRINFSELLAGAYDADGDAVSLRSVRALTNASTWIDWNARQVVFRGHTNFNGQASFEYTLQDANGAASNAQRVDVNVISVNDNPTVKAVTGWKVFEDGIGSNNQNSNESRLVRLTNFLGSVGAADVDRDALNFGEFWGLNRVSEVFRQGNDVLLRLERNYNGNASFSYRVRDANGGFADGQVALEVLAQNDRPWLTGIGEWSQSRTESGPMGGNIETRIYGFDIDSPLTNLKASIGLYPAHGILNQPTPSTYQEWRGKTFVTGTLPATWDLSYTNRYGDEASRDVRFGINVSDQQGGLGQHYVTTYHQGTRASRGGKPVAIDLNGDGINYTDIDDSKVLFDINGDGVKDLLSWTAADDGMIAFDKDGDGIIKDLDELSFLSYLAGSMTDLEGLNGFDTDKDGMLTANDTLWSKFGIWQDINQDGVTDAGEFKKFESWNITAINLKSDQMMDQVGDVYIMGRSTFVRGDGTKGEIADVAFRYLDAADTSGVTKPKTFNIDVEGVIRKRIEEAHSNGMSDAELSAMLQKFIADVANAGRKDVDLEGSEDAVLAESTYIDSSEAELLLKQQSLGA